MSWLLWALTVGAVVAVRTVVDDSETDRITYSDGWVQCTGLSRPECLLGVQHSYHSPEHRCVCDTTSEWSILTTLMP